MNILGVEVLFCLLYLFLTSGDLNKIDIAFYLNTWALWRELDFHYFIVISWEKVVSKSLVI